MADLHTLTIAELLDKLEAGECTSVDIVNDILSSIDATDGKIGAYLTLDHESALAQAKTADDARASGRKTPLL
ncbi:MAG: Asp-tRNA(Asn)/Glu-tRNA(Gln) amidotransferase GatCAB subunit A, partial [Kiritimatiellales bacterium]|nr:Asp-tRNA(Asn)/Glu-tRNA(Gln) amidotransferase GatCAB subunit A [Kiritimatiellales bacterium]